MESLLALAITNIVAHTHTQANTRTHDKKTPTQCTYIFPRLYVHTHTCAKIYLSAHAEHVSHRDCTS